MDNFAADTVIRAAMDVARQGAHIAVTGVKSVAALLFVIVKGAMQGKTKHSSQYFGKSEKPIAWIKMDVGDLKKFVEYAKRYHIKYAVIHERTGKDKTVAVQYFHEDSANIARIMDEIRAGVVDRSTARERGDATRNTATSVPEISEDNIESVMPERSADDVDALVDELGAVPEENPTMAERASSTSSAKQTDVSRIIGSDGRESVRAALAAEDAKLHPTRSTERGMSAKEPHQNKQEK